MNLYLRLLYTLIVSFWQPRARLEQELRLRFRTWPHDLDLNLHMNNGRYLTLMDLGRVQLMARLGLLGAIARNRWMPVVGSVHMQFRRSLAPFEKFELATRVAGWDEKWLYIEQKFLRGGELVAVAQVRGLLRTRHGNLPTQRLLELTGQPFRGPHHVPEVFR